MKMNRLVKISDIAKINANSLTQNDNLQEIIYLDTGSVTKNIISNTQKLNFNTDKIPSRAKRKVKDRTIIYSTVRPNQEHYGFLENPADNFIVSTGFATIDISDAETDEKYIFYLLTQKYITDYLHTIGENSVSSYPAINPDDLANLKFSIPNLQTQKSIANILSTLDQKIAINNQINAQLEQMAKTLYDYWFVQFDFPDENGKPYKSSGGEMVYNETLKREIPKGWEVKSLGEHITIKRGLSYKSNEIQDKGTPFINLNSFHLDGNFKFEGTKFFTGKIKDNDFICNGDVLIAVTDVTRNADIIGKAFILPNLFDENVVISCDVAKISSSRLNSFYLEKLFNSFHYHEYIKHFASGTLVLHLDVKGITWFETYIPPKDLLNQFELYCQSIHQRMTITQKQNQQLIQLRDFLLPMLMNGQVGVGDG